MNYQKSTAGINACSQLLLHTGRVEYTAQGKILKIGLELQKLVLGRRLSAVKTLTFMQEVTTTAVCK